MRPATEFALHMCVAHEAMDQVSYFQAAGSPALARRWAETARHNLDCAEQLLRTGLSPRPVRSRTVRGGRS